MDTDITPQEQQAKILERIIAVLPYSSQIKNISLQETASATPSVRFDWRGTRFRVTGTLSVNEVESGCLAGTNAAILLKALLDTRGPL